MKHLHATAVVLLALGACSPQVETGPVPADTESRALAAYIEAEYGAYLRDYIHVYVGFFTCSYGFADEDVFNEMADDVLRAMTLKGVEVIRAEHPAGSGALSDAAVEYAASMAVLTTMEMLANATTAEIQPIYDAVDFDCSASEAENRARYESLRAFEVR